MALDKSWGEFSGALAVCQVYTLIVTPSNLQLYLIRANGTRYENWALLC